MAEARANFMSAIWGYLRSMVANQRLCAAKKKSLATCKSSHIFYGPRFFSKTILKIFFLPTYYKGIVAQLLIAFNSWIDPLGIHFLRLESATKLKLLKNTRP